jgi:hypothetical protein
MWRSALARCLVWFVALAGLGLFALGQVNTGNVFGRVVDMNQEPLPGGTVELTGPLAPRSTVTDPNGNFRFLKVPPGRYKVTVTMPGFSSFEQVNVIVSLGKNTDVGATLQLANVQESITVTSATPLIETRKVETGATFSEYEMQDIPTSRDIYSLMQQVPGIQIDTVNVAGNASGVAGGPDFTSKGASGVTYQIDGATITDNSYGTFNGGQARQSGGTNTYFDFDTFQEVDVSTGGSQLELQQPGTTVNVVTKRGTNELKGSARWLYASANWQATNTPQEAIDEGFTTNSTRFIREYGAELGGPIVKDRLWLWASASRQDIGLNQTGTDPEGNPIQSDVRLVPYSAKLNAQIVSSNALGLFYSHSDRFQTGRGNAPDRTTPTLTTLTIPTDFYKLEDNQVFSPDLFGSMFVSYQFPTYDDIPDGGLGAQSDYVYNADSGEYNWLHSYYYYISKNPQYQGNGTMSKFFNTGKVNHELKASFNYRRQINDSATGWPGDQIFGYTAYAYVVRNVRTIYKTEFYAGTLGDTLTAGNLTVNAGVRYDVQRGRNLPSEARGNPLVDPTTGEVILPPVIYQGDQGWPFNYKDWQPRVSAAYSLGKNHTTQLRGSYARYADQLGFLTYEANGLSQTSGFYYYWTDNGDNIVQPNEIDFQTGALGFYVIDPSLAPVPANQISPNLVSPKTDEFTFGIDQQISNDFALSATYTYRHLKDLQYSLPIGAGPDTWYQQGTAQGVAVAQNGFALPFDVPFYALTLEDPPVGKNFFNRPGATQTYNGIEFSAVKRLSNKWMLRGSVAWNNWRQQIPPEAVVDPNNRWNLAGQDTNNGLVVGYSGKDYIWINARWQFNVTGLYQFPFGINFSANLFGREGYPQAYYIRDKQTDGAGSRQRNLVGQIDSYRLDNVYQLDLHLEKAFNIGPVVFTALAEVFNVTNNAAVLQRVSNAGVWNFNADPGEEFTPNGDFNQIFEVQSPTILRLGARIAF